MYKTIVSNIAWISELKDRIYRATPEISRIECGVVIDDIT